MKSVEIQPRDCRCTWSKPQLNERAKHGHHYLHQIDGIVHSNLLDQVVVEPVSSSTK